MSARPRLRIAVIVLLAGLFAGPFAAAATAAQFFSGIEDLPLMPGLTELAGETVIFDKPQGRIVTVAAEGALARAAVLEFYRRTLPQLGWRKRGAATYLRAGEMLRLVVTRRGRDVTVRFTVAPQ
jgi:hypothetical protein